jgi:hypothetical protein
MLQRNRSNVSDISSKFLERSKNYERLGNRIHSIVTEVTNMTSATVFNEVEIETKMEKLPKKFTE